MEFTAGCKNPWWWLLAAIAIGSLRLCPRQVVIWLCGCTWQFMQNKSPHGKSLSVVVLCRPSSGRECISMCVFVFAPCSFFCCWCGLSATLTRGPPNNMTFCRPSTVRLLGLQLCHTLFLSPWHVQKCVRNVFVFGTRNQVSSFIQECGDGVLFILE